MTALLDRRSVLAAIGLTLGGFVTLPCGERGASAPRELLGCCDCGPPRVHRLSAKHAMRLG